MQSRPASPNPTRGRPKRRLLALAIAGLLLGGGFAIGEAAGWPWLAGPLERRLSATLQRPLRLLPGEGQALRIRLLGQPQIEAGLLQLDDLPAVEGAEPGRPMLEAEGLRLRLRWSDLFALLRQSEGQRELFVEELSAQRLRLAARRDGQGRANWLFGQTQAAAPTGSAPQAGTQLRLRRLWLQQAEGSYRDAAQALDLGFRLRMDSPPPAGQPALQAQANGRWRGQALQASLQAATLMPLIDLRSREAVALQLQLEGGGGQLRFDGQAADLLSQQALRGRLQVEGRSLAQLGQLFKMTLPNTPAYRLDALLQHGQQQPAGVWLVDVKQARIGGSDLRGDLRFDARPLAQGGRARLSGTLHAQRMRLVDLGPAIGAGPSAASQAANANSRLLPQREFDLPALRAMDADVRFNISRLELDPAADGALRPLAPLAAWLRLDDGLLRLDEIQAGLALGRLGGSMSLNARQPGQALWNADLRLSRMQLESLLPAMRERQPPWLSGHFNGALQLKGSGRSTAALLGSADGQIALLWQNGRISNLALEGAGLDLAQGLGRLLRGDKALPVACGVALLQVRDGRARPAPVVVDTSDSTLWLEGELSLADERLDLRLLVAPRDRSLLSLRSPLRVSGSLADPQLGLQGGKLAARLLPSAMLALLNPAAGLIPLLDAGDREQAQAAARACAAAYQRVQAGLKAGVPASAPRVAAASATRNDAPRPPG